MDRYIKVCISKEYRKLVATVNLKPHVFFPVELMYIITIKFRLKGAISCTESARF